MNGCTTITLVFGGSDSDPRPMAMGDAGVPMGDAGRAELDAGPMLHDDAGPVPTPDAGPAPTPDAGTDSGPVVTVDSGTESSAVIVEPYGMRESTILVGDGGAVWHMVSGYRFHAVDGSIASLDGVDVILDGDAANINMVAIASEGVVHGSDIFPSGVGSTRRIDTSGSPISAGSDGYGYFQIWVKVANVQSSASVSGATTGVCNSGDRFRVGAYNVDYHLGSVVAGTSFDTIYGNEFQIRKTRPTVTRLSLSTTTLSNGTDQDLYRFQVSADAAGSIGIHSISFDVSGTGVTLSNFRLRKGSTEMSLTDCLIVDETAANLSGGSLVVDPTDTHRVVIWFLNEQTVTGSGNVYTLHATPSGVVAGDSVSFNFHRTSTGATGYLLDDPIHSALDTSAWGSPRTGTVIAAGFIWSDFSEVPHSDFYGVGGGSRDWTDGLYIEDLTQTQTLSR
ncbi:hypothetical protein K8R04_04420 [Candidatus Uhrbacteria bacterium]|nr:hypothetical protein [Candidatus Uhrbacteria bacterium]